MRRLTIVSLICTLLLALVPGPRAALAADDGALPPAGMFQLPFPIGETWTFNGVHGPRNEAIDFSVGRPWPRWRSDTSKLWVVAAAPGKLRKVSGCGVEIDHADGWTSVYYHIEQITRDSGEVQANEKIGIVANTQREAACEGGYATAPHLHFALKHNGQEVPLSRVPRYNPIIRDGVLWSLKGRTFLSTKPAHIPCPTGSLPIPTFLSTCATSRTVSSSVHLSPNSPPCATMPRF